MEQSEDQQFNDFINFHALQLYAVNFPKSLEKQLYNKLKAETFDIGSKVKIVVNEEENKVDLVCQSETLKQDEDVFLIDHAWTFKYKDAEKFLNQNDKLLERMENIVQHSEKQDIALPENKRPSFMDYIKTLTNETKSYDFDNYGIKSLAHIPFSEVAEDISLYDNKVDNPGEITSFLYTLPNLRALWLNNNPVVDNCVNFSQIGEHMPKLEILNSRFTSKAGEWAFLYYAKDQQVDKVEDIRELDLSGKGVLVVEDLSIFERMTSLKRLNISDHPEFFMSEEQKREEEEKMKEGAAQQDKIEFVQHKNTLEEFLQMLKHVEYLTCDEDLEKYLIEKRQEKGIMPLLKTINRVKVGETDWEKRQKEKRIRQVMDKIWRYANTYRLVTEEQMDEENIWYVMDEVGSSMSHSDKPNMAVHPLIYAPNNKFDDQTITYSICWPLHDIHKDAIIYRDYLSGIDETKFRSARLLVWFNTPYEYYQKQLDIFRSIKPKEDPLVIHQQLQEKYPPQKPIDEGLDASHKFKVFSDYSQVVDHLTNSKFNLVQDPREADIIWKNEDFYGVLQPVLKLDLSKVYLNQFEYEGAFVMKNHLANLIQQNLLDSSIIQETYILNDYLPSFIGRYNEREKLSLDNTWILKPTNMARSMDTTVTNNLDLIVRMVETGPKIAQKYIENPCTLGRKKYDLRFVALLKSVNPLDCYVYEEFYTRFSNNEFEMSEQSFAEYETHFTVMNYKEDATNFTQMRYFDFVKNFDQEYQGQTTFSDVKKKIEQAIKSVFIAFQVKHGADLKNGNMCRGLYGVDVMITDKFEPKILEFTFSPDCKRACKFNPDFYNDVFSCLFLNQAKNMIKL